MSLHFTVYVVNAINFVLEPPGDCRTQFEVHKNTWAGLQLNKAIKQMFSKAPSPTHVLRKQLSH